MKNREYYESKIEAAKQEIKRCKQALRLYDKLEAMDAPTPDDDVCMVSEDQHRSEPPQADSQTELPGVAADVSQEPPQADKSAKGKKTA